jgi:hypothetical protein
LEWLAERAEHAYTVAAVADWMDTGVPKVQGALSMLRKHDLVAHFPGDPGTWAITRQGLSEIRGDSGSVIDRYRMALETLLLLGTSWDDAARMRKIAAKALEP